MSTSFWKYSILARLSLLQYSIKRRISLFDVAEEGEKKEKALSIKRLKIEGMKLALIIFLFGAKCFSELKNSSAQQLHLILSQLSILVYLSRIIVSLKA
jgi:hypothetical protein